MPATGGARRRVRIRAAVVGWIVFAAAALTGCVEVPVSPAPSAEPELSPQQKLAAMPEVPVEELQSVGGEAVAFLTENRNAYCAITTEQGGIINSPVDPRLSGGQRDDSVLEVPAVYCELARYPDPAEITDDCHGTGLGFKGGTVLLTADGASYGGCRVGMTLMESELGPGAVSMEGALGRLPVLEDGLAVELNGFRCGTGERGLVCVAVATETGFAASADTFEIFAAEQRAQR
ncbi:hypothetical protein SAMN04488693_105173 [Arthrobacter subterraneus]|uniref:Uncharacterized protein n=1 Tax=Arthrobacter subterraneus TaxID=335973 RepID=A0A1G8HER3_9MICC|nr:hypothetical protein [Arthrobacter subterraneus]SDI05154.1 hypothetical protein SAMN04488693_105173 [Arthrobacter subterraneus]